MKRFVLVIVFFIAVLSVNAQINVTSSGDVGIGTSSPTSKLHVYKSGTAEVKLQASSSNIARFWVYNSLLSYGLGVDGSGYGKIYQNINSPVALMTFSTNGNIGINTSFPSERLYVTGNIRASGTITDSDRDYKNNIKMLENQSKRLYKLESFTYNLKNESDKNKYIKVSVNVNDSIEVERAHYGFIAQDIQKIFPELVYENNEGMLGVDYVSLIPLIVEELKAQQSQIEELKKLVNELSSDSKK